MGSRRHKKKGVRRQRRQTRRYTRRCEEARFAETREGRAGGTGKKTSLGMQLETRFWKGTLRAGGGLRDCRSSGTLQSRDSPEVLQPGVEPTAEKYGSGD